LVVTLGGRNEVHNGLAAERPGIAHILEASSGREVHAIDGLTDPAVADLDGDGLNDLWGQADRQLQAFRGEAPEVWRALGIYSRAARYSELLSRLAEPAADFDGDGIGDTLIETIRSPSSSENVTTGSRTVVARSGRDGRVVWKTRLDPRSSWDDQETGDIYRAETFPLPTGDLDGDGTPDVIVRRTALEPYESNRPASLPLDLISGRTGRQLWSAGPLPLGYAATGFSQVHSIDARVIEPGGASDLLVLHDSPFSKGGLGRAFGNAESRLARVSGRDGHVFWDTHLMDRPFHGHGRDVPAPCYGDVDGDGVLDVVLALRPASQTSTTVLELKSISLRDGKPIWSRLIEYGVGPFGIPQLAAADLDGDKRSEVIVTERKTGAAKVSLLLEVLDGRDGSVRWTWRCGEEQSTREQMRATVQFADFDGSGQPKVCLEYTDHDGARRLVILDATGREVARRDLARDSIFALSTADLDGDGLAELVLNFGTRVQVLRADLSELWSRSENVQYSGLVVPASSGESGAIVVDPAMGLDGRYGHVRWAGQSGLRWYGMADAPRFGSLHAVALADIQRRYHCLSLGFARDSAREVYTTPRQAGASRSYKR
jgi:hypothetical protein